MGQVSLINGLQYGGYALELALLVILLFPAYLRRFPALCAYVASLFVIDAVARAWTFQHYGRSTAAYYYVYWLTDLVLALGVYLLVCSFFRRAFRPRQAVWGFIRPILTLVLVLVILVSGLALKLNIHHLFTNYIYEFTQDLYFVCLVLTTALYLMLQRFEAEDGYLNLLVCGLGVQLAGQTAGTALLSLMPNRAVSRTLMVYLSPLCFVAMMGIWIYAITRVRQSRKEDDGAASGPRDPRKRRRLSAAISAASDLKTSPAGERSRSVVVPPGALQAGYLNG